MAERVVDIICKELYQKPEQLTNHVRLIVLTFLAEILMMLKNAKLLLQKRLQKDNLSVYLYLKAKKWVYLYATNIQQLYRFYENISSKDSAKSTGLVNSRPAQTYATA